MHAVVTVVRMLFVFCYCKEQKKGTESKLCLNFQVWHPVCLQSSWIKVRNELRTTQRWLWTLWTLPVSSNPQRRRTPAGPRAAPKVSLLLLLCALYFLYYPPQQTVGPQKELLSAFLTTILMGFQPLLFLEHTIFPEGESQTGWTFNWWRLCVCVGVADGKAPALGSELLSLETLYWV